MTKTLTLEGRTVTFRAFEQLDYCKDPKDPIQKLNIFVPEAYYHDEGINGYTAESAPVFLPNTVGGYMPGPCDEPGIDSHTKRLNSLFCAIEHGYVAVSAGIRGRTSGKKAEEFFEGSKEGSLGEATGEKVGRAPALIVDCKAAIRYLRHNAEAFPGNKERIITNGTSAGGALSALAGATGNSADYEPYLKRSVRRRNVMIFSRQAAIVRSTTWNMRIVPMNGCSADSMIITAQNTSGRRTALSGFPMKE